MELAHTQGCRCQSRTATNERGIHHNNREVVRVYRVALLTSLRAGLEQCLRLYTHDNDGSGRETTYVR